MIKFIISLLCDGDIILFVRSSVRLFVSLYLACSCRPLADWRSSAIMFAAGRDRAGPRGLRVSQMFRRKYVTFVALGTARSGLGVDHSSLYQNEQLNYKCHCTKLLT